MYKSKNPFNTPLILLVPQYKTVDGVRKKTFPDASEGIRINASFKTYGGTEIVVNNVLTVVNTADVETWYRPEITSDCIIVNAYNNFRYEIIGDPENIDMRNQLLKFKVRQTKGGV